MSQFEIASLALNFAVLALCYVLNKRTNKENLDLGHHRGFAEAAAFVKKASEDLKAVEDIRANWKAMDKQPRAKNGQFTTKPNKTGDDAIAT